jgi:hypothetical protein
VILSTSSRYWPGILHSICAGVCDVYGDGRHHGDFNVAIRPGPLSADAAGDRHRQHLSGVILPASQNPAGRTTGGRTQQRGVAAEVELGVHQLLSKLDIHLPNPWSRGQESW